MDKEIKIENVTIGAFADYDPVQGAAIDHSVKTGEPLFRVTKQTVIANEGGFEPHPESYTPRVFVGVMPDFNSAADPTVYEILQNGQAIPWPCLPVLEGFDYWVLYVDHLSDVDMRRAPKRNPAPPFYSKGVGAFLNPDPVPQADGFSESGTRDHLPEGSH